MEAVVSPCVSARIESGWICNTSVKRIAAAAELFLRPRVIGFHAWPSTRWAARDINSSERRSTSANLPPSHAIPYLELSHSQYELCLRRERI
jgi:hypothetical protein